MAWEIFSWMAENILTSIYLHPAKKQACHCEEGAFPDEAISILMEKCQIGKLFPV